MRDETFWGAKLAVLNAGQVLTLQRDDRPDIAWPGRWDLPGGGREGEESPIDCAIRETWEEAGVMLRASEVVWQRDYVGARGRHNWFLVAEPGWLCLPVPRLGSEGRAVRWMEVDDFLALPHAVPHLQERLRNYLQGAEGVPQAVE